MLEIGGLPMWVVSICLVTMSVALIATFVRMILGPTLADRIVALDLVAFEVIAMMLVYSIATDRPQFLEPALVLALIAFLGTVAFSRYIENASVSSTDAAEEQLS